MNNTSIKYDLKLWKVNPNRKQLMTLEECKCLIAMLSSTDSELELLALNLLDSDPWFQRGSITTAVYEARRELKNRESYAFDFQKHREYVKWILKYRTNPLGTMPNSPGTANCILALEKVEKELS